LLLTQVQCSSGALSLAAARSALEGSQLRCALLQCDAESLDGVWRETQAIADACGATAAGEALVRSSQARLSALPQPPRLVSLAVLQWTDPLFAAGGWVPEILPFAGCEDVLRVAGGGAAKELDFAELLSAQPSVLVIALCGLSAAEAAREAARLHSAVGTAWARLPAAAAGRVFAVDATRLFTRAEPRVVAETAELLHLLCVSGVQSERGEGWLRLRFDGDSALRSAEKESADEREPVFI
jgi:iron complex transport system substrate-binding protein